MANAVANEDRHNLRHPARQFPTSITRQRDFRDTHYLEDGDLSIDNNAAERGMKIPALGRKNWLFVASRPGGHRAAILMSLVASAKANHVEPWSWLRDVFAKLPRLGPSPTPEELSPLLPDRWLTAHPDHRWHIADQRQSERTAKQR